MTKTFFFAASVALAAVLAGCSADTTEDGSPVTTATDTNGTLPVQAPDERTPADAKKPDAEKVLTTFEDVGAQGDGIFTDVHTRVPALELQKPALVLKPEPLNQ